MMFFLQVFRVHITLCCCATVIVISTNNATSATFMQRHFQLQANPRRGPVRLGDPWIDKSRRSCAKTCMSKYKNCTSFLFNSDSRLCTPGAYINEKQPLPSPAEGDFFQSFYCDTSNGFQVRTYRDTVACLAMVGSRTYMAADADCQSKGAYLMSVKTEDKYSLLINLSGSRAAWIGCDDIQQEGQFVWKDDGQKLTDSQRATFFVKGDPNDHDGSEDCVLYSARKYGFLDTVCTVFAYYICEMPYR